MIGETRRQHKFAPFVRPSMRPKLLPRPDGGGPIGQRGAQGQVVAITDNVPSVSPFHY